MKRREDDQFLEEILRNDDVERLREASLAAGLNLVRRQHVRRKLGRIAVMTVIPALLAVAVFSHGSFSALGKKLALLQRESPHPNPLSSEGRRNQWHAVLGQNDAPTVPTGDTFQGTNTVKTITSEELFALLPHHTLALIGKPGHQQLICLDQPGLGGDVSSRIEQ